MRRYFKYLRMTLPPEYNALVEHVLWYRKRSGSVPLEEEEEEDSEEKVNGTSRLAAAAPAEGSSALGQQRRGWWGRGRKLAGMHVFEEPEDGPDDHWRYVQQPDSPADKTVLYEPRTLGGAAVKVLHYAVEAKPWLRRPSCRRSRRPVASQATDERVSKDQEPTSE